MDFEVYRRLLGQYTVPVVPNSFQFKAESFVCLTINWTDLGAKEEHAFVKHKGRETNSNATSFRCQRRKSYIIKD
jgi:hypothetical protein